MARKTEIVTLDFYEGDPRRFELIQFKPKDGHAVLERLLRVAAPVISPVADNLAPDAAESDGEDLDLSGLGSALEALGENLAKNEGLLEWLVQKVKKTTKMETDEEDVFVTPTQENWDDIFAGEYGAELSLVIACLKLNYRGLASKGGGLGKIVRRFATRKPSRSSSPTDAPSGSGAS